SLPAREQETGRPYLLSSAHASGTRTFGSTAVHYATYTGTCDAPTAVGTIQQLPAGILAPRPPRKMAFLGPEEPADRLTLLHHLHGANRDGPSCLDPRPSKRCRDWC
ncbi:unnamed protein product, partial [Ectocarpus fasciculatus]